MNDTELLDKILEAFECRINPELVVGPSTVSKDEMTYFITWIKAERTEEALNEKIRREVKKQIKRVKNNDI